jgi:hypothetical protein
MPKSVMTETAARLTSNSEIRNPKARNPKPPGRPGAAFGALLLTLGFLFTPGGAALGVIRDGGVDSANLGQGGWLYLLNDATNHLAPNNIAAVTNENSLFQYLKGQGLRYVIVKAGSSDVLYTDTTYTATSPVFTSNLVNRAHANGLKIFGSNRSWGINIAGEIAIANYVFNQGADGFIYDAESEWEASPNRPWITNAPAQAWWLCGTVRSNWPTKFIAHNPYDTLYTHAVFPYKEFGYWCDAVMPQVYHHAASQGNAFAAIHWTDVNYKKFQDSLASLPIGNSNGLIVRWTKAIKPLALMRDVYGENFNPSHPPEDVRNFLDYLVADPNCVTAGGYRSSDYFRSELHDTNQWAYIKAATIGVFPDVVNNIVMDDAGASQVGSWTVVPTIDAIPGGAVSFTGEFGTDTDSFGTNYWKAAQGTGSRYMQFTPTILTGGDYLCYQWHPSRADASASVPHVINYNGGSTTVYANQQTNAGNWTLLGQFNFAAGTAGNIRVTDGIPEAGAVAMADGMKLVFVGGPTPPTIIDQPQGASILPGQSVTFSVTTTGTSPLAYQWRLNSVDVPGATSSALMIDPAGVVNAGAYSVRVTNAYGMALSTNAGLVVIVATTTGDNTFNQNNVPAPATNLVAIAAGAWHSLGLRQDGTVLAWGSDAEGQCAVPVTLTQALAIAAGGYHSLAIQANGTVAAWGADDDGQATVPAGLGNVIGIAAGTWHSLALRANGTVVAWGDNSYGQTNQPVGLSNVVAVAAGGNHNLALRADGTVVGWGENTDAEGSPAGQSTAPWGLRGVVAVGAGQYHSLAVKADGTVIAWGDNAQGQCNAPTGLTNAVAVAGGGAHSLALGAEGAVTAWGADGNGQCDVPVELFPAVGIAAGNNHTVLLLEGVTPVPQMLQPARKGSQFSVLLQTLNRKSYALERKDSLAETNWTVVCTNSGNGVLRMLADPSALAPQRFYRTRQW